jgi:hypothetical protein
MVQNVAQVEREKEKFSKEAAKANASLVQMIEVKKRADWRAQKV